MLTRRSLIISLFFLSFSILSHSAEVKYDPNSSLLPSKNDTIFIIGTIEKGDYEKVKKEILGSKSTTRLEIKTPGGDIVEAMKIGRFVRETLIEVVPSRSGECSSAGAFIWLASVKRFPGKRIGIHRPYFDRNYFSELTMKEAKIEYNELEKDVKNYLYEMEVPKKYINKIYEIPSGDMYYLTKKEILDLSYISIPPSYEEWIISKCGMLNENEKKEYIRIFNKVLNNIKTTKAEDSFLKLYYKKSDCAAEAHRRERQRILNSL